MDRAQGQLPIWSDLRRKVSTNRWVAGDGESQATREQDWRSSLPPPALTVDARLEFDCSVTIGKHPRLCACLMCSHLLAEEHVGQPGTGLPGWFAAPTNDVRHNSRVQVAFKAEAERNGYTECALA